MRSLHRVFQLCLFISLVSGSASAQSWLDVSPTAVYLPPGDPSCYTISVGDAPYMVVDLEGTFPWGPDIIYGVPLDFFGQATLCTDGSTSTGDYFFTGVRNSNEPWWGFTATWIQLTILPRRHGSMRLAQVATMETAYG